MLVSLFTAGLKLRTPFSDERWQLPVRLASLAMLLTVGLIAAVGVFLLGLPLGAAICSARCWHQPIRCLRPMCKSSMQATVIGCGLRLPARQA